MKLSKPTRKGRLVTLGSARGQGLVEYALILLLVTIVVVALVRTIGESTNSTYESINSSVSGAGK